MIIDKKYQMKKDKRINEHLVVQSSLNFYDNQCFCGKPYIYLTAYKDSSSYGWKENQIGISIHDYDDFFLGFVYYPEPEQFFDVLHELINWMNDLEHGILYFDEIFPDIDNFFPKLCERKRF